jgi:hypothetical protein
MKLTTEQFKKANSIAYDVNNLLSEHNITDKESFFSDISAILCQFDTDIAINVLERFKDEGQEQALSIKVNYGY